MARRFDGRRRINRVDWDFDMNITEAQHPLLPFVASAMKAKISGHYRLVVGSSRGRRVVAEFDNLILDIGLDRMGVGTTLANIHLGTGTLAPATTQTGLVTFATQTALYQSETTTHYPGVTPYTETVYRYRFNPGTATGTFSEIGAGWGSAPSGVLFSRALILDSGGSPTTITVLSDEYLDVEYRIRMYVPTGDATGVLTISGTPYPYTIRAGSSASWRFPIGGLTAINAATAYGAGAVLGPLTGTPTGASPVSISFTSSYAAYVPGSYNRTMVLTAGLGVGNATGGIQALTFVWGSSAVFMQARFDTPIPKDATKILTVPLGVSWARRP